MIPNTDDKIKCLYLLDGLLSKNKLTQEEYEYFARLIDNICRGNLSEPILEECINIFDTNTYLKKDSNDMLLNEIINLIKSEGYDKLNGSTTILLNNFIYSLSKIK